MKKSKWVKKGIGVLLAISIAAVGLCGCGKSDTSTADNGYKLNVAITSDSALTNPLIQLAEEKGYFEQYDLTLSKTTLELANSGLFDALSIGKIDTNFTQLIPPLSYGAKHADVTLFAGTVSGGMCIAARADEAESLSNLDNWKGKKIGVIELSTSEMVSKYALENDYGYDIENDLEYVLIDNYPDIITAVQKGNVDIGFIGSAYVETASAANLSILFPLTALQDDYVCCRQTAYSKSFEENRDAFVAYLKGQILAYKDYREDEQGTITALAKATGETEDYIYSRVYDEETNADTTYNPDPNYNGTLSVYETLVRWNYIEDGTDLSEFYDLSVYADALKEVIAEYPDDTFYQEMWTYFEEHNDQYPDFGNTFTLAKK
jgi:NitT/TauT family transport system substrate-binding protein